MATSAASRSPAGTSAPGGGAVDVGFGTDASATGSLPSTFVAGFHDEAAVRAMPYRQLGETGMLVSALSFGTSSLMGVHERTTQNEANRVVHTALARGINYIDTAPWYGHGVAEEMLGIALQGVPRESYFLATKVGRYDPGVTEQFDFRADTVTARFEMSLERLGVDYVDVLQVGF